MMRDPIVSPRKITLLTVLVGLVGKAVTKERLAELLNREHVTTSPLQAARALKDLRADGFADYYIENVRGEFFYHIRAVDTTYAKPREVAEDTPQPLLEVADAEEAH